MIEKVFYKDKLLALIVRKNYGKEGVNFLTDKNAPLQLGISVYKKNTGISPHVHSKKIRRVSGCDEIIGIVKGRVKVSLFNHKNRKVADKILNSGDIILLFGAHGFKMLAPTKLFEVKQGPYINKENDKKYLHLK